MLTKSLEFKQAIFEVDSQVLFDMISKGFTLSPSHQPLLEEANSLLRSTLWKTSIYVVNREANMCVDLLVNKGHGAPFSLILIDSVCPLLEILLSRDIRGAVLLFWFVSFFNFPFVYKKKRCIFNSVFIRDNKKT